MHGVSVVVRSVCAFCDFDKPDVAHTGVDVNQRSGLSDLLKISRLGKFRSRAWSGPRRHNAITAAFALIAKTGPYP